MDEVAAVDTHIARIDAPQTTIITATIRQQLQEKDSQTLQPTGQIAAYDIATKQ